MHMRKTNRIAIVGAGDMGSSVAAELHDNGFDINILTSLAVRSFRVLHFVDLHEFISRSFEPHVQFSDAVTVAAAPRQII